MAAKLALNTKAAEIENKIPDATGFISIPEFNRFKKKSFDTWCKNETKSETPCNLRSNRYSTWHSW